MNSHADSGIALTCKPDGVILEVIRDDFGITQAPARELSLAKLASAGGSEKVGAFLETVRSDQRAFGWELTIEVGGQPTLLYFTGGRATDDNLLILGATTRAGVVRLCDELVSTSNEHATVVCALRTEYALLARVAADRDSVWYDELTRLNNDLATAHREQAKTTLELARLNEQLSRSNAELAQFAYVASHDLQEPLRMVSSYTQLLSRRYKGRLDADADEFIAYAVDGANRMQTLINDLLAYSRVGTRGKEFEATDCMAAIELALVNLRAAIEESSAVVTHGPLPTVMADRIQIGQLLQNLIGNAVKYHGAEPPRVHVSAEQKGNDWVFAVRDNGIGIDPQYAERIFVVFQRLHTREEYPGTGIGLAICKKIVERHGGRIWVESQAGTGATFYFTIPLGVRTMSELAFSEPVEILLVEDNPGDVP